MSSQKKKNLARSIHIFLLAGAMAFVTSAPVYAVPINIQLPSGFESIIKDANGNGVSSFVSDENKAIGTVHQTVQTAVNKWDDFSIGADATVNFTSNFKDFNSVNFVNSGKVSEIYGQINANGGNIFLANTAGVQISGSAQINVGSLYVTNKNFEGINKIINKDSSLDNINSAIAQIQANTNAELMSLGGIVTTGKVTFDGNRVVIDTDHLYKDTDGTAMDTSSQLTIKTVDADNVVLGYTAYDSKTGYKNADTKEFSVLENGTAKAVNGYMWVENLQQLQAMNTKLDGNYALRNSIDANYTDDSKYNNGKGFASIGSSTAAFTGNFDGLGYDIFDLNINRSDENNVGLFGYADGAIIRNFTLNSGSIAGKDNTGAVVGYANNSKISNIINTANVSGTNNVGSIVGKVEGTNRTQAPDGSYVYNSQLAGLINTGNITGTGSNIGGIAGSITNSSITGETYNLGAVTGIPASSKVGGIVGNASNSSIGNGEDDFTIYNQLDITGGYNIGGIAGNISGTDVQNVANYGAITAIGATSEDYQYHTANGEVYDDVTGTILSNGVATIKVSAANAGGIVGNTSNSSINKAENNGDVTTAMATNTTTGDYYNAGNVGGIAGRAYYTDISNVVNKENTIAGAHNVGGAVGYMTGDSVIDGAINNGGDITATGARRAGVSGFAQESVRSDGSEKFNIGNIGGIVGYMYGDDTFVKNSANRGTVHSAYIKGQTPVPEISKAANVGGVVGKIDRSKTESLANIKADATQAAVYNSYNTGNVEGYTGIGGVAGFMYNGEVARAYNLGTLQTTRQSEAGTTQAINMGGVIGDSTEQTNARILAYDVYNAGQIGDEKFNLYGRHVGGVVGRLSGTVEKAYNTGDIYNGFNVVGGIVGYWYAGNINNTFNTGNITVINNNNAESQVGGIVGAADLSTSTGSSTMNLSNSYNLGTLRSFMKGSQKYNELGGIIGYLVNWSGPSNANLNIDGVYTLGNLYVAKYNNNQYDNAETTGMGAIVGGKVSNASFTIGDTGAFYIKPESNKGFSTINADNASKNGVKSIAYGDRYNLESYGEYTAKNGKTYTGFTFSSQVGGAVNDADDNSWRIYDGITSGTTPILNEFLPNAEDYFDQYDKDASLNGIGIDSIQYGTAYNPLLTIVNANGQKANLDFKWKELGITGAAGLAVYGAGLTINGFASSGTNTYFGGTIYSDGALTLNGTGSNFNLGAGSNIYGSSVTLDNNGEGSSNVKGDITIYGKVTSTNGDITIDGDDVEIIGTLTSSQKGAATTIAGITATPSSMDTTGLNDPNIQLQSITKRFTHKTANAEENGNITITADGTAEILYGHLSTGKVTSGGNLTVKGGESVYIDTDLHLGGDMNLSSSGEMLIDISNMGDISKKNLHKDFLDHFKTTGSEDDNSINVSGTGDFKIAVDMWDYTAADGKGGFNLKKYDVDDGEYEGATSHTLSSDINNLNINYGSTHSDAAQNQTHTYIWINNAEQLKGIQAYKDADDDIPNNSSPTGILGYNFALKNDIDASKITDYKAIASDAGEEFTGHFDGRGNRVIGLEVGVKSESGGSTDNTPSSAGIFGTIGEGGLVEDLKIYSSSFYGKDYAGAVAGINNGTIKGITTLGNHVEAFGSMEIIDNKIVGSEKLLTNGQNGSLVIKYVGAAGGIAGKNSGSISDISASDSVVAGDAAGNGSTGGLNNEVLATAGGIAGINDSKIENVTSDSAVTASQDTTYSLGGVVGLNRNGSINIAYNTGITHGEYGEGNITSNSVGGIAGVNTGSISNVYNGADITGGNYVGGIVGYNHKLTDDLDGTITIPENSGLISNAVNAGDILADFTDKAGNQYAYTGGLAGYNSGTISSGRNTGEIYGGDYVGGMVGGNAENSVLSNLSNSVFASITGEKYVGGIAGQNSGSINATDSTINNYGKVYGQHYVGGIAGANEIGGRITNTISSISLHVKNKNTNDGNDENDPKYFGGVVGQNSGTIIGATNESSVDVAAEGATNVGGIIGHNTVDGKLEGEIANKGTVSGLENVGGIIGKNENNKILNNNDSNNRLVISNSGKVSAADGGAAGIFYENTGEINNVDLINTGTVIGGSNTTSITGGLFGINRGNITNSTLTNNGMVVGGGTVGGLIGQNSVNVSTSSLINSVNGTVIGFNNVGGLIGINTGTITGGRTDADGTDAGYYKYQIYNNGVITAGTWNDQNKNGIVDVNEIHTTDIKRENIGGLFGTNSGEVTAAYNTGAINAAGSTNVGGIAGTNAGTLDQVFNTVMVADGSSQTATVTGGTNVGGIVGTNENTGKISNAYNTTIIDGANAGGIAGINNGTIDTAFTTTGTAITSSGTGKVTNGHVLADDENKNSANYGGFGFDKEDGFSKDSDDSIWKIYDGQSLAMLKVFLTSATVDDTNFVYNGKDQFVDINDIHSADNNAAYENNNSLISFIGHKNAGTYDNWLYSGQIAASGSEGSFNPNNLGYDIVYSDTIAKAKIDIGDIILNTVDRVYGSQNITDGNYGFQINSNSFNEVMRKELEKLGFNFKEGSDTALTDEESRVTGDVSDNYSWSGEFTLTEELAKNYYFKETTENGKFVIKGENNSHVNKAGITITIDDKVTIPGYTPDYSGTNIKGVLVNGDGDKINEGDYHYGVEYSHVENQVGTHKDSIGIWINGEYYDIDEVPDTGIFKNYDVTINMGDLTVTDDTLPEGLPDKPDSRWDYLYKDAPFDRNKDFRERKAEINFVDGGMKI